MRREWGFEGWGPHLPSLASEVAGNLELGQRPELGCGDRDGKYMVRTAG